jgi:cell division protease FtsH
MITEFGMSEALGPVTVAQSEGLVYLGHETGRRAQVSESIAELVDHEVRRLLTDALTRARDLIRGNVEKLHTLARGLLERETLDRPALEAIMRGESVPPAAGVPASGGALATGAGRDAGAPHHVEGPPTLAAPGPAVRVD